MKKLIMSAVCAMLAVASFSSTNNVEAVDVYSFKASIKQPLLKGGVRSYTSVTLKGNLYVEYASTDDSMSTAYAIVQNSKTKVVHRIDFTDGFYNLMGKSSKESLRTIPTVFLTGADSECTPGTGKGAQEPHENIIAVNFAGSGKLKKLKTTTITCGMCGASEKTTDYCNKLQSMSGNVTGYMDCECPEDENWNHTAETIFCGVKLDDDGGIVRSHEAAFWGSWSAKFVKTTTDEQ